MVPPQDVAQNSSLPSQSLQPQHSSGSYDMCCQKKKNPSTACFSLHWQEQKGLKLTQLLQDLIISNNKRKQKTKRKTNKNLTEFRKLLSTLMLIFEFYKFCYFCDSLKKNQSHKNKESCIQAFISQSHNLSIEESKQQ